MQGINTLLVTSGLSYWLNATSGTIASLANGAAVSSWADSSVNNNTFTGTATYLTSGINGLPAVNFNGTSNQLKGSSTTAQTVFIVNQVNTIGTADYYLWGETDHGGDLSIRTDVNYTGWSHPGNANDFAFTGAMYMNGAPISGIGTFPVGSPHLVEAVDGSSVNGTWAWASRLPGRPVLPGLRRRGPGLQRHPLGRQPTTGRHLSQQQVEPGDCRARSRQ